MIVDQQARLRALDPNHSFIVQAPAGSGKTGLLVYRFLVLLNRVNKPQNVLAITFTRKARAEMQERILELLLAAQSGLSSADIFEQQGIELATKVLESDQRLGWKLLEAPHQLQILTIDAFSAKLAASMPWLSRLGERPKTTDTAHSHYEVAVEQVLNELLLEDSQLSSALQTVLHELDFNYDKARKLFTSMLAKRDQWLRHFVHQDSFQLKYSLQESWSVLVKESLESLTTICSSELKRKLVSFAVAASRRMDYSSPRALQSLQVFNDFEEGDVELTIEHWQALSDFVLVKQKDKVRRRLDKSIGFPEKSQDKQACSELFDLIQDDAELIAALAEISLLPNTSYSEVDWVHLQALEQVLKALAVRLQLRFRAAGECDHSEITQRANLALAELQNPTDLGLMLDGQIQHILVDEFQDTSITQLRLLQNLTLGWQTQQQGSNTLFLVGDPMQSIYRFREADVGLFLQVVDNQQTRVFEQVEIESLVLSQNFRSNEHLVDWFNSIFSSSFPATNDVLSGAIAYSHAFSNKYNTEPSPIEICLCESRGSEAKLLLEEVKKSLSTLPRGAQIAILVRTRTQLSYLLPVLEQDGIDYAAVDIDPLHDLQAVKDVISLVKVIASDDKLAWLALLRGPWCGLTLNEIVALDRLAGRQLSLWDVLSDLEASKILSGDSLARALRFFDVVRSARQQYQQTDLGTLTRWAWLRLGGARTLMGCQYRDVQQVFDLLNELQRGGALPQVSELETGLERLRASQVDVSDARVVVSTIHKSKGLQYHTVMLPGLGNKPRVDDREILMWAEHQTKQGESKLLLAPLKLGSKSDLNSHYEYLRRLEAKRSINEAMRLMYVACTRAEHRLLMFAGISKKDSGDISTPAKSTLLASIWSAVDGTNVLRFEDRGDTALQTSIHNQTLNRVAADYVPDLGVDFKWKTRKQLHKNQQEIEQPEVMFDWATEVAAAVGVVLHNYLQYAGNSVLYDPVDQSCIKRWRAELSSLQVPSERLEYAVKRVVRGVENIQADKGAHFIFWNYEIQQNEYAISNIENGSVKTYRIDRTFVDQDGIRWIIDYKSTTTNSNNIDEFVNEQIEHRHRSQLQKYARVMSEIDDRPIRLAVYFPLLKALRYWDYEM